MQHRKTILTTTCALLALLAAVVGCTPRPKGTLTIANLAGVHFARAAKGDGAVLAEDAEKLLTDAVAEFNATKELDFVVLSGNLLQAPRPANLDRMKEILDGLRVPYFIVLGNTDMTSGLAGDRAQATVSRSTILWTFQGHGVNGPEGYWVHQIRPGTVLVGLDTARVGRREGFVDDRQLRWLDETLKKFADKVVIIVAHHGLTAFHPFDESVIWQDMMVKNADAVREVIARYPNVLLVMTGHHHFAAGKAIGPVIYISGPSLTVWPLAYHLVRLTPKSVEALWLPVGGTKLQTKAEKRLFADKKWRSVFPEGEQGDTDMLRLFGGQKSLTFDLITIRP